MTYATVARVPTTHASRYLQQVCKHWAHNMAVAFDATKGTITFPSEMRGMAFPGEAVVTLTAEADALVCAINASAAQQRDGLKGAVERHVDRFAFREAPLSYVWQDA